MRRLACSLILAAAVPGCHREPSPPAAAPADVAGAGAGAVSGLPRFEEGAARAGLRFENVSGSREKRSITDSTAGGGAVLDFDGDGFMDLYLVSGSSLERPAGAAGSRLFRNRGDGGFEDATAASRAGLDAWGQGAVAADCDGDGDADIYVTCIGPNRLLRNQGGGKFIEGAAAAGVEGPGWSTGAAFADADGDGDLDLFVAGYVDFDFRRPPEGGKPCPWHGIEEAFCGPLGLPGERDAFYRNRGDGTFVEASAEAGLADPERHYGFQPVFFDPDRDGDPDLFVANDSRPNCFYRNRGGGVFEEAGVLAGVAYNENGIAQASMGAAVGDVDGDGWPDLYVTNFDFDTNTLYRNTRDGFFEDATAYSGLGQVSYRTMGWGAVFADLDADGDLDLYSANGHIYPAVEGRPGFEEGYAQRQFIFLNDGKGRFSERAREMGLTARACARGALALDLENDGDVDLLTLPVDGAPLLWVNHPPAPARWIEILPRGAGKNRDAAGARIAVGFGGREIFREVLRGEGYLSSMDPRLHFGLGNWSGPVRVEATWRSGKKTVIPEVTAGRVLIIEEGP